MKGLKANETVLSPATSTSNSVRTTVPAFIVGQLNMKAGDVLAWSLDMEDGKFIAKVKKAEKLPSEKN